MHLAALAVLFQPEPQITLDLPATRLTEVAQKIKEASGEEVKVTGPDLGQFVFVRVEKMPFSRLRESLAFVTGGRWVKAGEVWTLQTIPEDALEAAAYRQAVQGWLSGSRRLPGVTEGLTERQLGTLAELVQTSEGTPFSATEEDPLASRTPLHRLVVRTLLLLPPTELLTLRLGERKVFALLPTALQRALPPSFAGALREYLAERKAVLSHLAAASPMPFGAEQRQEVAQTRDLARTTQVLLILARGQKGLEAEMQFFDPGGKRLLLAGAKPIPATDSAGWVLSKNPGLESLAPTDLSITLPGDQEAFGAEFRQLLTMSEQGPGGRAKMSQEAATLLQNQAKQDLLSLHPSTLLKQFAVASRRQAVIKLNDIALRTALLRQASGKPLRSFIHPLAGFPTSESNSLRIQDDLVCSRPAPLIGRWALSTRGRLSAVAAIQSELKGSPRLEVLAGIASKEGMERDLFWPALTSGLFSSQGPSIPSEGQIALLRIYGLLSPDERARARSGGVEISFPLLQEAQQSALKRLLLDLPTQFPASFESSGGQLSDLDQEPTVLLAGVSPSEIRTTVSVSLKESPSISLFGRWSAATPHSLAVQLRDAALRGTDPSTLRFTPSRVETLTLAVQVGRRARLTYTFALSQVIPGAKPLPFSKLPQDVLKEAERMHREWTLSEGGTLLDRKPPMD